MTTALPIDTTAPYATHEGRIGLTNASSDPHWPASPTARAGAPNIVIVMADDLGFGDLGSYGSEIETPNLDQLAARGVRYTNFHVNPMCSPTRASLLTGLNSHAAGVGHVAHSDPGFPGYAMEIAENAATLGEVLRDNGYDTMMVGKWHLTKDSHLHDAAPKKSWPCQKGFDKFYGILDGFTNFHQPHRLYDGNHHVDVDSYPDDYYFTDDLTDKAISWIRDAKASDPTKPFFLYFAHGAVHAPLQAKAADIEKYRGVYDAGWDEVRQARYERQLDLGVIPAGTVLPPRNSEDRHAVKPWDDLSATEQELFARYMEIYAGMVDSVDQSWGRVRSALDELGELDNTIVLFTSDNGGSREGQENGTAQYFRVLLEQMASGLDGELHAEDYAAIDLLGGPQTLPHYNMGWAMVSSCPFRLYKINTHAGGHQVPMIISWPDRFAERGGELRQHYQHVTDVMPTLLDMIGVEQPSVRNGVVLKPIAGASFAATVADAGAPSSNDEQYYEMIGHRGLYKDGWEVVTLHNGNTKFGDHEWELYHLAEDPTEVVNLAGQYPERVTELAQRFDDLAWANQVYPLDEGTGLKMIRRPPSEDVYELPITIFPGSPTLERYRSLKLVNWRSWEAIATLNYAAGDAGYIFTHGDQGGGYALAIEAGELKYIHNGYGKMSETSGGPVSDGPHEIVLRTTPTGRLALTIDLLIDGVQVASAEELRTLTAMAPFEGITVGLDRRSPVSWRIHEAYGSFRYSGDLAHVRFVPGELSPMAGINWLEVLIDMGLGYE